jgi:hypothetical protein
MSYMDFCRCTPQEFFCIHKAFIAGEEEREKSEWERMRMLATITIQPHVKGHIKPQKLLPFPWEKPKPKPAPKISMEERAQRIKRLIGK